MSKCTTNKHAVGRECQSSRLRGRVMSGGGKSPYLLLSSMMNLRSTHLTVHVNNEKHKYRLGTIYDQVVSKTILGFHFAMSYDCETCCREFTTWHGASQHMNALDHWAPTFDCQICNLQFNSQSAANQHMEAKDHFTDRWCHDCDRGFGSANNYRMVSTFTTFTLKWNLILPLIAP